MGLIFKNVLKSGGVFVPEGAVNIFLRVPKSFLSAPYELQDDAVVLGEIMGIEGKTIPIYPKRDVMA